jgi:hypothetical protein
MIESFSARHGMKASEALEYNAIFDYIFKLARKNFFDSTLFSLCNVFRFFTNVSPLREVWLH